MQTTFPVAKQMSQQKSMCTFDLHKSTKIKLRLGTRPSKTQEGGFVGRLRVGVYQAECTELAHTHFASGILSPIRTPTTSPASRSVSLNYTSVVQLVFLLQPDSESFADLQTVQPDYKPVGPF